LAADHQAANQFLKITRSFEGTIPQSAIDARANPFHTGPSARTPTRTRSPTPTPRIKLSPSRLQEYIPLAHRCNLAKEEQDFLDSKDEGARDLAERRAQNAEDLLLRADFAYRVSSYSTGFYSRLRASMSYSLYAESLP
jgi:hypothetical protein